MSARVTIKVTVNGKTRQTRVPAMKRLLDVLREDLELTGTKEGCGEGECGACTVLLDGVSVNSCLVPAVHADGRNVVTVEGLGRGADYSALQQAFVTMGGAQCGICTPGILVAAHELLVKAKGRKPTEAQVREAIAGNLCRCTGYQKIVEAVLAASVAGRRGVKPARVAAPRAAAARRGGSAKPARSAGRKPVAKRVASAVKRLVRGAAKRRGKPAR